MCRNVMMSAEVGMSHTLYLRVGHDQDKKGEGRRLFKNIALLQGEFRQQ